MQREDSSPGLPQHLQHPQATPNNKLHEVRIELTLSTDEGEYTLSHAPLTTSNNNMTGE